MDVFKLRENVVGDYEEYVRSFFQIRDERVRTAVEDELGSGRLWPEPLLQLNPAFEGGGTVEALVREGVLERRCAELFRIGGGETGSRRAIGLHRHQVEAIQAARRGANYVVTTGTGSGKSLTYIIPIVDAVLREGSGKGVRAIIVYPMNALANSQMLELEKFLGEAGSRPVTFARYTGQESVAEKEALQARPPDILLTNFVMLELILTRAGERRMVAASKSLRFLVLDELHTYRGRQGSDVALLVRRVREVSGSARLQCVGTSATLTGPGTPGERRAQVARVASTIFGATVEPADVIGETLRRSTVAAEVTAPSFLRALRERVRSGGVPAMTFACFVADPLAAWIESTFGVTTEPTTGELIRAEPARVGGRGGAAEKLAALTGCSAVDCERAIRATLLAGARCEPDPKSGFRPFAFRLHQFFSRGDAVYATVEDEGSRFLTLEPKKSAPEDPRKILLPLVFCRNCGQDFYCVRRTKLKDGDVIGPRMLSQRGDAENDSAGFLYLCTDPERAWPDSPAEQAERAPEEWFEETKNGTRARYAHREKLPQPVYVDPSGAIGAGLRCHWIPTPFHFCPACRISYDARQSSDFGKLASLGTEGRSTATTVTAVSIVRNLHREPELPPEARKVLSFTDNRQDASLQSGHFNDFVQIGLLRAALYKAAVAAGSAGIPHETLTQRVHEALGLSLPHFAQNPEAKYAAKDACERAFREVLGYRLYFDLRRGWRITSPNLEHCGLLEIRYASLDEIVADAGIWASAHPLLAAAPVAVRRDIVIGLLDHLRRALAVKVDYLDAGRQESIRQMSSQHLREPWALDDRERMESSVVLFPRSRSGEADDSGRLCLSARGLFGNHLQRHLAGMRGARLKMEELGTVLVKLVEALARVGLLQQVVDPRGPKDVAGYQLPASAIHWVAGDGTRPYRDVLRVIRPSDVPPKPNPFFVDFYRNAARDLASFRAAEHTAQVPAPEREKREKAFREGSLPVLFCSPTMELGVDIRTLNVVHLRNAPPTPANYAQRSGRAGRSGQPAFVATYCTSGSPHDQYFFRRPERLVAGAVATPNLDLANEDLIRSHVHAIWLAETGASLGTSLKDVLDVDGTDPSLRIRPSLMDQLNAPAARDLAGTRARAVLAACSEALGKADWFTDTWLDEQLDAVIHRFDLACERWRGLYQSAHRQAAAQTDIILDASRSSEDKRRASSNRKDAEDQLKLLTAEDQGTLLQSDFYSYRYFASEGFLPGYNFPRLPLSAFIPARGKQVKEEFLSRPRFLAISEFGPRTFIYHEGSRYQIKRVMIPANDGELPVTAAKICSVCGYLHELRPPTALDTCEACGATLPAPIEAMFRLLNVATRRRDRISSDEEERQRSGFDIRTVVRFSDHGAGPSFRLATIADPDGSAFADLKFGDRATLWRINLGERRRENANTLGFVIDEETGAWQPQSALDAGEATVDPDDALGHKVRRVVPYVEDRRNALVLHFVDQPDAATLASLQAALKHAIQAEFELEDSELAAVPLPTPEDRSTILFYEASEGGAGVLRRILDRPGALRDVARKALELCHFDPETGADLRRAPRAREDCSEACYDCLQSYGNQPDHRLLNRFFAKDPLVRLVAATVDASSTRATRGDLLASLLARCDSELERRWLRFLDQRRLRLPTDSQKTIESCRTRPDFVYQTEQLAAAVYIDGPHHDAPHRASRDLEQTIAMEDAGWQVIRVRHDDTWPEVVARHPSVFGAPA